LRDETTDRDPTYEALRSELAKSKTELAATQARTAAVAPLIRTYRTESQQLDRKEILHQDMLRTAKADEEITCCTFAKRRRRGFQTLLTANVFPTWWCGTCNGTLTSQARWVLVVAFGGLIASLLSVTLAFVVDRSDPSFRTPEEVESFLGSPVVAAFPKSGD